MYTAYFSQACKHEFFNELRNPATLIDSEPVPSTFFIFTDEELSLAPEVAEELIPPHMTAIAQAAKLNGNSSSSSSQLSSNVPFEENSDL